MLWPIEAGFLGMPGRDKAGICTEKRMIKEMIRGGVRGMNRFEYVVAEIDGDYARLRRTDQETEELKLVARALLPPEIMEGTKLLYEWMSYSIME